ncbi:EAL domain-containing protein [Guyparkeria halophila]|uniref:cyclic-guanylate-specific phosphodiesterase n=2 Tax=Guyparkeria halophila TaxID=47960 RepID=A0A6I6D345_9GAMM|nr:EAL domain-containing protein [Guyparkeria halophila]
MPLSGYGINRLFYGGLGRAMRRLAWALALSLLATAVSAREVTVGLYENDPKVFRDEAGQPAGIFVDLIERIAVAEGWTLSFEDCAWGDCLDRAAQGQIDLMPDVAISEAREARLDFHALPALHSWSQVYRRPDLQVRSILDLDNRRIALLEGSIQQSRIEVLLDEFGVDFEPLVVEDFHAAFAAVADGRADVAVVNHLFGSRYHDEYALERTPVVMEPARLFFATGEGRNPELLAAIDRHLSSWQADGDSVYFDILERWLGERPRVLVPGWVAWLVGVGGALLFLALGVAFWLRRTVVNRGRRLAETRRELETAYEVIEASPVVLFRWRLAPGWPVAFVSGNVSRWGYTAEEFLEGRRHFADIVHPDDLARISAEVEERLAAGATAYRQEYRILHADGTSRWVGDLTHVFRDEHGQVERIEGVVTDITEQREGERRQREAAAVLENTLEGVIITDADERIVMVNRAFQSLTGYTEDEVLGQPVTLLDAEHATSPWSTIRTALATSGHWQGELTSRRKNGEIFPELRAISRVVGPAGEDDHVVHLFTDMSRLRATEARLDFLARHDALTDLPNRALLLSHLHERVASADVAALGLLLIDLDRFRDVNDSYGHHVGDTLLRQAAQRLESLLEGRCLARLGGDEFAVLAENLGRTDLAGLAETIIEVLSRPWRLDNGTEVRLGASIGITCYPDFGRSPEALLQQADASVYRAKAEGRGGFRFFDDSLTASARHRIEMETRLRRAIEAGELELHYQPQVEIASGRIIGAEALVRWRDGERGLVPPDAFIPVAEQTGMIGLLGEWVLREACRQGREWRDAGLAVPRLAVNLSARQLHDESLVERVRAVLDETGYPPDRLELELTESALMHQQERSVRVLRALRRLGLHLAIDDFGTGYSSLAYLRQFPIDVLKIDKRFVDDLAENNDDREIAGAILAMGHALRLSVIAEGVETEAQLAFLRANGCDTYQGYLFSPPLPPAAFARLLAE